MIDLVFVALREFAHSLAVGNSRSEVSVTSGRGTAASTYTVRRGDTLSGIAAEHGTSAAALAARNGLADLDDIRSGDHLSLP
jgi:LysM repeat protein